MADNWQQHVLNNLLPRMEATSTAFEPGPANPQPLSVGMNLQPTFDPIETLPAAAAEKLRLLRQRSADAHLVIPEGETVRQASMARIEAQNELKRRTDHTQDGGFGLKPGDPRVVAAEKHLLKMTDDFERLRELQTVRTAQWHAASAALPNAETWLKHGLPSGVVLQDYDGPEPKLLKNDSITDAIERLRRRVRELRADAHRVSSSPYPSSYCKARAREMVEQLAARGAPDVTLLIEHDREVVWPTQMLRSDVRGGEHPQLAFAELETAIPVLAWLLKGPLISALDALVDAESDDAAAMSHEARQKAEAETVSDLIAVEREESFFVWQAQQQGLPVEHRGDISPVALLGLRMVTAPSSAPPPTSPEHGYNIVGGRR